MSGRWTSHRVRNPLILLRLGGFGRPVRSDVRWFLRLRTSGKMTVVRWVWVNKRCEFRDAILGGIWDFGVKIDEISWMKDGETWGDARSIRNQANPWIKINKPSSNQQIIKKWGYFWWGFSNLGKNTTKSI